MKVSTAMAYELTKLGVTPGGNGRWHVEVTTRPLNQVQQRALHKELLAEYQQTLPGVTIQQLRQSLEHGYPILPAYRDGDQLRVWCDHEQKWHLHDTGDGFRLADCDCKDSPLMANGYEVHEVGLYEEAEVRRLQEWPEYGCATCDRGVR
jgi:hypothetical protein